MVTLRSEKAPPSNKGLTSKSGVYRKLKITSILYDILVIIYCYLQEENYEVLKFHVNNSSDFKIGASLF